MKTIRTVIQLFLAIIILILGYLLVESILKPIRFNKERTKREVATIERLKDIRTAQLAFKSEYNRFTGSFDTLIHFIKNDSFRVVKKIGSIPDSLIEAGMTEEEALKKKMIRRDTIRVSIKDSLFKHYKNIDSLRYVPYCIDVEYVLGAGELETGSNIKVKVFEAYIENNILLHDLDPQLIANYNDERSKIAGFPGLKVGSLTEATNNAGNWE